MAKDEKRKEPGGDKVISKLRDVGHGIEDALLIGVRILGVGILGGAIVNITIDFLINRNNNKRRKEN